MNVSKPIRLKRVKQKDDLTFSLVFSLLYGWQKSSLLLDKKTKIYLIFVDALNVGVLEINPETIFCISDGLCMTVYT